MAKKMRDILCEDISQYKRVDLFNITTIKELESLGEGAFVINEIPSVKLMKKFPFIFSSNGEVSLVCIDGIWIITISKHKSVFMPAELDGHIINGTVQFFAHSHPGKDESAKNPSFPDMYLCNSIDKKIYIIHYDGITEVDISQAQDLRYINEKWENFLSDEKITYDFYIQNKKIAYEAFLNYIGCKKRTISFNSEAEIRELMQGKMALKNDFWDKETKGLSYPIKKQHNI